MFSVPPRTGVADVLLPPSSPAEEEQAAVAASDNTAIALAIRRLILNIVGSFRHRTDTGRVSSAGNLRSVRLREP